MASSHVRAFPSLTNSCFQYSLFLYPSLSMNSLNCLFVTSYLSIKKSSSFPRGVSAPVTLTIPSGMLPFSSRTLVRWLGAKSSFSMIASQLEVAAKTVSKPSFSIFHLKIPMGNLTFSRGETPKNFHSLSGAAYSFMYASAPGGSVLMFRFKEHFEKSSVSLGSFGIYFSVSTASR